MTKKNQLLDFWDFNWAAMDVLLNGKSAIDLNELRVKDWDDATKFLRLYGLDPDNVAHAIQIHALLVEAINFISKYLMPAEWSRGQRPPDEFFSTFDVRHLMLWASDLTPERQAFQIWSCAILRVMHTIAHIEGVRRYADLDSARQQIMGPLENFVFKDADGKLRFGKGEQSVGLHKVEWKYNKRRESVIMKLLHKKGNVAETIYDFLGVRIVTDRLSDTLIVIKLLRDLYIVSFPNCNPARAKNTLLNMDNIRANLDVLSSMYEKGQIDEVGFADLLERAVAAKDETGAATPTNPHSSLEYRSVQLTCRQLVHSKSATERWRDRVQAFTQQANLSPEQKSMCAALVDYNEVFSTIYADPAQGYFPFEIHILDRNTYVNNHAGEANHDRYKTSQIREVRRRVLGQILTAKSQ